MNDYGQIFNLYVENTADLSQYPPLLSGERLVYLVAPDGSKEVVAFGDKYWDALPSRPAAIARAVGGEWSHGIAKAGHRIEEIEKS